jgi:hypothetical protein
MHPLFEDTTELSDNDLEEKVIDLTKRYWQTANPQAQQQITLLIDSYRLELETRRSRQKLANEAINSQSELDKLIKVR